MIGPRIGTLPKNPLTAGIAPLIAGAITLAAGPNSFTTNEPTFVAASLPPAADNPLPIAPLAADSPLPNACVAPLPKSFKLTRFIARSKPLLKILLKVPTRPLMPALNHPNLRMASPPIIAALRNVFKFLDKVSNFSKPSSPYVSPTHHLKSS